jgi:hypothetical protein
LIVTGPPTAVIFRGCDETPPLDPLKLSEVLERETLLAAQHGAPSRLAMRVRRMCFVKGDKTPEQGIWEPKEPLRQISPPQRCAS